MKIWKNIQSINQKNAVKKSRFIIYRGRKQKAHVLIKDYAEEVLKFHIKDYFKINDKQMNKIWQKVNLLNSKILKEK